MSVQHDVPAVYHASLSPPQADMILQDIRDAAHDINLRVRQAPHRLGDLRDPALDDVPALLRAGHAVQIRYRFADTTWSDTLSRQGDEIQLVRCEIPTNIGPS